MQPDSRSRVVSASRCDVLNLDSLKKYSLQQLYDKHFNGMVPVNIKSALQSAIRIYSGKSSDSANRRILSGAWPVSKQPLQNWPVGSPLLPVNDTSQNFGDIKLKGKSALIRKNTGVCQPSDSLSFGQEGNLHSNSASSLLQTHEPVRPVSRDNVNQRRPIRNNNRLENAPSQVDYLRNQFTSSKSNTQSPLLPKHYKSSFSTKPDCSVQGKTINGNDSTTDNKSVVSEKNFSPPVQQSVLPDDDLFAMGTLVSVPPVARTTCNTSLQTITTQSSNNSQTLRLGTNQITPVYPVNCPVSRKSNSAVSSLLAPSSVSSNSPQQPNSNCLSANIVTNTVDSSLSSNKKPLAKTSSTTSSTSMRRASSSSMSGKDTFLDPMIGAPYSFQQRVAEISTLENETLRWEKARAFRPKRFRPVKQDSP